MAMRRRFLYTLLVLQLACVAASQAQEKRLLSRETLDSFMTPKLMPNGSSVLLFDSLIQDFGVIYEHDAPVVTDFSFVNVSSEPVVITRITSNCGCTVAEVLDSLVSPDEKGVIRIKFDPHRRSGTVDTNTFVYTSHSSKEPVVKLTLLGNVIDNDEWSHLPCTMGSLKLTRKEVAFEPVKAGTSPQQRIPCANVGTAPLSLSSVVLPAFVSFATEPAEIAPGEEGEIIITIDGNLLPHGAPRLFSLVVDGVEGRISDRTIKVKLEK